MKKVEKQEYLADLKGKFAVTSGLVFTGYQGLTVSEISQLRKDLKPFGCKYIIIKNTLVKLALKNASLEELVEFLSGPMGLVILNGDPLPALKKLIKFSEEHEKLKIVSGYVFRKATSHKQLVELSKLPPKEVILAKLLGILQAPAVNLLSILQAPAINLACLLNQLKDKKGGEK